MTPWECAIDGDGERFADVEELIVHQATEHDPVRCRICGTELPDGYFAIRHAFENHSRAEYVRAYDADAEDIRTREHVKQTVEREADLQAVLERIEGEGVSRSA